MRRVIAVILAVFTMGGPTLLAAAEDPELDKGIALVRQGEYGLAIIMLDPVARRLSLKPADGPRAAQAHLHLGIAYLGEGQEALARAAFRDALSRDATLQLSAFDVSPKVRELFQKAKDELAQQKLATVPAKKGGGGKTVLIVLGVAALGGGVAVAAGGAKGDSGGEGSGSSGIGSIDVERRTFLMGVGVRFVNTGGCSSVTWDFGEGSTGSGLIVTHSYPNEGTFNVVARCSAGGTGQASVTVSVRSLAGTWSGVSQDGQRFTVQLAHSANVLSGNADGVSLTGFAGTICQGESSRCVNLSSSQCFTNQSFQGIVNDGITVVTGTGVLPCQGSTRAQTLTRQ